ncbi:Dipeptidyl aminopeptidase/acylaminoacyl peptidase [Lysobacter sp. yr284]|uniref:prolyl oligopeptidase family serine peptidase n=1 Tax=Lysobacter sp. yr284 TaxID=1761791 RepID=UPI0008950818|nr:prolyl oligopeptidase family serine peptidase [Lysobacter sp. yr284]SDY43190.1 Dipeptidyl aminopeptidase/acylaminoacyl peptidase [Lysobacter sp. yr284]
MSKGRAGGMRRGAVRALGMAALSSLLSSAFAAAPARPAFDIDDLLSAPQPEQLTAAAAVPVIAWVANERGVRNLWSARAPQFVPRKLSGYDEDDGQLLTGLQLSRDGRWLAYVRGGSADAAGSNSNPDWNPDGREQAVWVVASDGSGQPQRIAAGRSVSFAPGGDALIVQGRSLGCHALPGAAAPSWCKEALLKTRGANSAGEFSPDGKSLAFVSNRGDHSFIGLLDLEKRQVRWMGADFNNDASPAFSPDGRRIAFLRTDAARPGESFDLTKANPFEIWVADTDTGLANRVFRSSDNAGGYAQFNGADPLMWSRDGRLIFASEQSGWLHWYALAPEGGTPQALSRGECEAESVALAEDGAFVFSGNCAQIDYRQVFSVDAQGKAQTLLTAKQEIAVEPLPLAGGEWIALRHADARRPTAIAVMPRAGGEPRRIFPAQLPERFPLDALVQPATITLKASDGIVSHATVFEPPASFKGKRPALVYVHGGPIRQMLPGWHYSGYYYSDYANNQWLASRGYVVLALNYRDGTGYGQTFRLAEKQGPRGASEYQDVLAAHAWLAARGDVDARRIGIYGGSYGGFLTSTALARNSDLFAAGADRHGVHDWRESAKGGDNSGLWGLKPDELELAFQSSPVSRIDGWRSPVLVIHGDDDRAVKFAQGIDLVERLRERKLPVQTLVIPDEDHLFLRHATWLKVHRTTEAFFRRQLKPGD